MKFNRLKNLEGKTAVITGAAGQVGYATAIRFAEQGCRVIGLVRKNLENANKLFANLPNSNLHHKIIQADILDSNSLNNALMEINQCDILINAAGITKNIPPNQIDQLTDDIFDNIVETNLRAVFSTIRTFHKLLKASGDGLIVNISSTAGQGASNSNLAYGAAKAGLDQITRSLAKALAPEIRIISVVPGFMENATSGAVKAPGFNEKAAESCPLKRIGYADDIASTIEACATHIRFATGSIFLVDGGRTV